MQPRKKMNAVALVNPGYRAMNGVCLAGTDDGTAGMGVPRLHPESRSSVLPLASTMA